MLTLQWTGYYFLKTLLASCYLFTIYKSLQIFLFPLIDLYGGWTLLGYWFLILIFSAITSFGFLMLPKPKQPQATYKDITS